MRPRHPRHGQASIPGEPKSDTPPNYVDITPDTLQNMRYLTNSIFYIYTGSTTLTFTVSYSQFKSAQLFENIFIIHSEPQCHQRVSKSVCR